MLPRSLFRFFPVCCLALSLAAGTSGPKVSYIPYGDAKPVLEALAEVLPAELKNQSSSPQAFAPMDRGKGFEATWPGWVARRDAEIRARLAQGDEDSIVNFLLFGTSFTKQPRITPQTLERLAPPLAGLAQQTSAGSTGDSMSADQAAGNLVLRRADDLVRALSAPGDNERLLFAHQIFERKGYRLDTPTNREQLKAYLLESLRRVLREHAGYAQALAAARLVGDPTEEFAERSKLYRTRGLSLDTSLLPNFAVEESLKAMLARGLLTPGSVRSVAVIGPGLDFADKQNGYDFYPQQTIQPFALVDTLLRLDLARTKALEVTTFDISPRVNHHVAGVVERARRGRGYVVQLPRDPQAQWKPAAIQYWERFGAQIGATVPPLAAPANAGELKVRAVRIRPAIVSRITPEDLNIVLQRLDRPATDQGFDLVLATNVFVYYDIFEQCLALANVERMLRPGGFLLSNNALLELPSSRIHSVGYLTTVYSDRPDDGDHIVWYQRSRP